MRIEAIARLRGLRREPGGDLGAEVVGQPEDEVEDVAQRGELVSGHRRSCFWGRWLNAAHHRRPAFRSRPRRSYPVPDLARQRMNMPIAFSDEEVTMLQALAA